MSVFAEVRGNRKLTCVVISYGLFVLGEYASWLAILVVAFDRGGATESGLVALAQLVPAACLAPLLARAVESGDPIQLRIVGHYVQAGGLLLAAVAALLGVPLVAYVGAVIAAVAIVTTRPAQAAVLPTLADTPEQLTAGNVALGWVENGAIAAAGLVAGLLLAVSDPGFTLGFCALLMLVAALAMLPLNDHATDQLNPENETEGGLAPVFRNSAATLLLALLTTQWIVVGALDVLYVVLAIDVLNAGDDWVGYLQAAFGVGALVASGLSAALVGRRLGVPILVSLIGQAVAVALVATTGNVVVAAFLLAGTGAGRAVLDVAGRTLLQRSVSPHLLGRTFGALEGLSMGGRAVGSLFVPALVAIGGSDAALVGVGVVLLLAALVGGRPLMTVDARATVPVVEIALLRQLRLFARLAPPELEGLARSLERTDVAAGTTVIREGDVGDYYYAIGTGQFEITRQGRSLGLREHGDGVGEIALLRDVPRTATVKAHTDGTLYALDRESFLTAVTGHAPTHEQAGLIVDERLRDEDPAGPGHE
jgi:hypothetical protein